MSEATKEVNGTKGIWNGLAMSGGAEERSKGPNKVERIKRRKEVQTEWLKSEGAKESQSLRGD